MLWAHLGMGNKEEALADLEKAYSEHFNNLTTLKVDPAFDPLRSDPRFPGFIAPRRFSTIIRFWLHDHLWYPGCVSFDRSPGLF